MRLGDGCSRGPLDLTLTPTAPCLNAGGKAEILALAQQNAKIIGFAFAHDVELPAPGMTSEVALPDWSAPQQFVVAVDAMPAGTSRLAARVSLLANASAPIFDPADQADFTPGEPASLAIPVPKVAEISWRWFVEAIDPVLDGGATGVLHASATYSNGTIVAADLLPRYTVAATFDANGTPTYTITGDTARATAIFVQQSSGSELVYVMIHPGESEVTLPPLPSSLAAFAVDVDAPPGLLAVAGSYITTESMARAQLWRMIGLGFSGQRNEVPLETTTYLSTFRR